MTFCKRNVEDILLYNWLSDGERVFLGRMALFQLLRGENDALMILDEPETHFNDVWKREIVDVIDTSLRDNNSEVIISTHSSISLTDVFDTEITLLYKNEIDGAIAIVEPRIPTFGASPNEIMIDIFGAPESVGQRATEFLDLVLMLAAHPDEVKQSGR
jgi:energy-coupling factor transporter ATP-binding protein EcfA2